MNVYVLFVILASNALLCDAHGPQQRPAWTGARPQEQLWPKSNVPNLSAFNSPQDWPSLGPAAGGQQPATSSVWGSPQPWLAKLKQNAPIQSARQAQFARTRPNNFPRYQGRLVNNDNYPYDIYDLYGPKKPLDTRDKCSSDYNIKFYWLRLQWPAGFCSTSPQQCQREPNHWTIHGMWAGYSSNQSAEFCCFSNRFDPSKLAPIRDDLETYWPSLFGPSGRFWSHEWMKHGTCACNTPSLKGEFNFFENTLKIVKQLSVDQALKEFKPSKTAQYSLTQLQKAVESRTNGRKVIFKCDLQNHTPIRAVVALSICFDAKLNFVDCPGTDSRCGAQVQLLPVP